MTQANDLGPRTTASSIAEGRMKEDVNQKRKKILKKMVKAAC